MKVLVTGGAGFIGNRLVEYYRSNSAGAPAELESIDYWKYVPI